MNLRMLVTEPPMPNSAPAPAVHAEHPASVQDIRTRAESRNRGQTKPYLRTLYSSVYRPHSARNARPPATRPMHHALDDKRPADKPVGRADHLLMEISSRRPNMASLMVLVIINQGRPRQGSRSRRRRQRCTMFRNCNKACRITPRARSRLRRRRHASMCGLRRPSCMRQIVEGHDVAVDARPIGVSVVNHRGCLRRTRPRTSCMALIARDESRPSDDDSRTVGDLGSNCACRAFASA